MIKMEEIPCLDYAERLTDDALFDEMNELEHAIFRLIEDYCTDKGYGVRAYMNITAYVRNLTACAWVAGIRNHRAIGRADHGEEITKRCERFWYNKQEG